MEVDHIIVGTGIAGASLAMELHKLGKKIVVWDSANPNASSRIAAGIMNPIVPKRITKTWMCDEVFPEIENYYSQLETILETKFYTPHPLYQVHATARDSNEWNMKCDSLHAYLIQTEDKISDQINTPFGHTKIKFAGRLNVPYFCDSVKKYIQKYHPFHTAIFDYSKLTKQENGKWVYGDTTANSVIFCEGIQALQNPWFSYLPFIPSGGDILEIKMDSFGDNENMYKQKSWLVPIGNNHYLAGSTFHQNNMDTQEKKEDLEELISGLKKWITADIQIVSHKRAVRPTVKDRRPFLGEHFKEKGLFIFNGLGTKGSSLCTWLAPMLAAHITYGIPLNSEVEISNHPYKFT